MSEIFALDPQGERVAAETAAQNPYDPRTADTGFFTGALYGTGMGIMRGGAAAARAIDILASAPVAAYEGLTGQEGRFLDDWYRSVDETAGNAVDFWTPNAAEVGAAGQILGGFSEMALPLAAMGGNPSALLGSAQVNTTADLAKQGVDATTATQVGLLQGAATAAGFQLPILGKGLVSRLLAGASGNLALNTTATYLTEKKLESEGYDAQAEQFNPADLKARIVDLLSGAAFGAIAHLGAVHVPQRIKDAALTAENAQHFQQDTAPGEPQDLESYVAHQDAMEQATRQLLTGDPISVPASMADANFSPRTGSPAPELPPEITRLDRELEQGEPKALPKSISQAIEETSMPAETRAQMVEMYRAAREVKPAFDQGVQEIAKQAGSPHEPQIAGLKNVGRAAEKTLADYGGDASRLKDIVRATVVVDNFEQLQRAIDATAEKFGAHSIIDYRDNLRAPIDTVDGYRDVKMNVEIGGHIAELQVNVPEMVKAKQGLHSLYEERRTLAAKTDLSTQQIERITAINGIMKGRYAAAWREAKSRLNAASSTSAPSSKAQDRVTGRPSGEGTSNARTLTPPSGVGNAATGTPPTFQKTGSLPRVGPDIGKPPTGASIPKDVLAGEHLVRAAKEAIMQNPDLKVATGETAPDGSGATMSAQELLAHGEAEIARAERDSGAFQALANCILRSREE